MIYESLKFLAEEVNKYLSLRITGVSSDHLVLGNVARVYDNEPPGPGQTGLQNRAILTLVNVEEDRISKSQEPFTRNDNSLLYKSPPIHLNLYMLISVNRIVYSDSLIWLGHILQFFQFQNVFSTATHPNLDQRIQRLVIDLHSMNFEQVNHLWSTLGGKYLPSALYKIRQVVVDENAVVAEGGLITEITINEKGKQVEI